MKPGTDRGKTRQLAAQLAMLFLLRREHGRDYFTDINSKAIDDFYYTYIDFDSSASDPQRLVSILDKLDSLLGTGRHPKVRAHDAIHLVLLVDTLWDEYTRSWEAALPAALDQFSVALAKAKQTKESLQPDEFWLRYGQWTRASTTLGNGIRHRHEFYTEKMHAYLHPLQIKDPNRVFGLLEREIIYFRNQKKCAVCTAPIAWPEVEIHHVQEHAHGGKTDLANAALVHKHCHPKGGAAQAFTHRGNGAAE